MHLSQQSRSQQTSSCVTALAPFSNKLPILVCLLINAIDYIKLNVQIGKRNVPIMGEYDRVVDGK